LGTPNWDRVPRWEIPHGENTFGEKKNDIGKIDLEKNAKFIP